MMGTSLVAQKAKSPPVMQEILVQSLGWENPWRREWLPPLVFLPGEFHEQRSLAGYNPRGHKESDMTKQLTLSLFTSLYNLRLLSFTFCSIRFLLQPCDYYKHKIFKNDAL